MKRNSLSYSWRVTAPYTQNSADTSISIRFVHRPVINKIWLCLGQPSTGVSSRHREESEAKTEDLYGCGGGVGRPLGVGSVLGVGVGVGVAVAADVAVGVGVAVAVGVMVAPGVGVTVGVGVGVGGACAQYRPPRLKKGCRCGCSHPRRSFRCRSTPPRVIA